MPANHLAITASQETQVSLLAAGDPVWGDLKPDDYKAYVRLKICTSFPLVHGPESSGKFFGFHPQVLANSHRSILHQQTNLMHQLKVHGAYRDRIVGTVVGVAFPENRRAWEIPEDPDKAPSMEVIAVLHKAAEGVATWLGNHQSGRQRSAVSIEVAPLLSQIGIFNPADRSILSISDAQEAYPNAITFDEKTGIHTGKWDGNQLGLALGRENDTINFQGYGYVPRGAEKTAKITDIRAGREGDDAVMIAAIASREWEPGDEVAWTRILGTDSGRGVIREVIFEGSVTRHGKTMTADPSSPLLDISVRGKPLSVLRSAHSVKKV